MHAECAQRTSATHCRTATGADSALTPQEQSRRAPLLLGGRAPLDRLQARDLAPGGDALARRQRDIARGAVALAEAALDAAVHDRARRRAGLQVLQVHVGVLRRACQNPVSRVTQQRAGLQVHQVHVGVLRRARRHPVCALTEHMSQGFPCVRASTHAPQRPATACRPLLANLALPYKWHTLKRADAIPANRQTA